MCQTDIAVTSLFTIFLPSIIANMLNTMKNIYLRTFLRLTITSTFKGAVRKYTPRRALMYVPGDDPKKLAKAFSLDVDCIAMDCEDGVAISKKDQARQTIRDILDTGKPKKHRQYDLGVRINSIETNLFDADIAAILTGKTLPDTILLPKVESADHIKLFAEKFDQYSIKPPAKKIDLIVYIESALAFVNLADICGTVRRLSETRGFDPGALVFGSDDFCANIGASRTDQSIEILYARQKLVLYAKAFNLQAIDMVYIKFKDLEGLERQAVEGARMGYTGKQVIHPGQVPVVQQAFLPNQQQVDWAAGLLAAFNQHQQSGKGAFTYRGSMIDMPTMKQAQNIMDLINSVTISEK